MLYLIAGSDQDKTRRHWRAVVKAFQTKHPILPFFCLTEETVSGEKLDELALSRSLFEVKFIVALDHALTAPVIKDSLAERLPLLAASPNLFICLEGELDTKVLEKIKKLATKVEIFDDKKTAPAPTYNPFALPRAVGERDRQAAWLALTEALKNGIEAEETFWKVVWQIKTMLLVKKMGAQDIPDLKPFVLSQAKRAVENYTADELENLYGRLIDIHCAARGGRRELPIALERWVLEL